MEADELVRRASFPQVVAAPAADAPHGSRAERGGGYKFFSAGYIAPVEIFGFMLAEQRIHIIVVCLAVFVGLELMVSYSRVGRARARVRSGRRTVISSSWPT